MVFMVESRGKGPLSDEEQALLPAESARGQELDAQGVRKALYLAADMSGAWQIFDVDSEETLQEVLESFPLYKAANHQITALMPPS